MSYQDELTRIQDELTRIQGAKEAMRTAIINKGVDVPAEAKLAEYPGYIAQIQSAPAIPDAPDLTKILTAQDLADIQAIVAAGAAESKFELGQTLLVTYDTYTMPFEIVGLEDIAAQVDGVEKTVHALNLLAEYTSDFDTVWGANGSTKYSASTLRTSITSTYQNKLNADFLACLANTKVQTYSRDGSTDEVYDKLFAPSMAQLGVTDTNYNNASQAAVEGPAFTAYQGSNNANRSKKAIEATSTAQSYWTRSLYSGDSGSFGRVQTSGVPSYYASNLFAIRVVVACNLVG